MQVFLLQQRLCFEEMTVLPFAVPESENRVSMPISACYPVADLTLQVA
ncbi:MAG: hypothetical protein RR395_01600 [Ruthenibacterium sp.]